MSNGSQSRQRSNPHRRSHSSGEQPDVAKAVRDGIGKEFMNDIESFSKNFKASNSQMRNIFSAVKGLEAREFDAEAFLMLRPRIAYATQRESKLKPLKEILSPAVDAVLEPSQKEEQKKRFHRFCLCCEAIVAYARK